jgi:hypothetical protein
LDNVFSLFIGDTNKKARKWLTVSYQSVIKLSYTYQRVVYFSLFSVCVVLFVNNDIFSGVSVYGVKAFPAVHNCKIN